MSDSGIIDSDYEDASDASESLYGDSPSDGYFTQRDHPPETFVEQSSVQADSDAKAREAAEAQANSSPATPPSQTSPTTSSRSPIWVVEGTALLDAGPAPPDYAAATANRSRTQPPPEVASPSHQDETATPGSYGTIDNARQDARPVPEQTDAQWPFGNRGNPFGADFPYGPRGSPVGQNFPFGPSGHPLGAQAQAPPPQSMQDAAADNDAADEETGLIPRKRRKHTRSSRKRLCRCCKPSAALNYLLAILVVGLVVLIVRATRETSKSGVPSTGDGEDKLPIEDGGDGGGDDDDPPVRGSPPNGVIPAHPRNSRCDFSVLSDPISFGFDDPENFSFTELMEPAAYMSGDISGNIYILPAPADQDVAIRVWVSFATPEPWHVTYVHYAYAHDSLSLLFPKVEKLHNGYAGKACMDVAVEIYVKRDIELGDWAISTANLNVKAAEYLFGSKTGLIDSGLRLTNTTTINAIKGHVDMSYWSSRETNIDIVSGSIHGTYALRDILSVRSHSGSIGVTVLPKEADDKNPAPAEFTGISYSGSVHVAFPTLVSDIPDRDYKTRVESRSSSVSGTYIHGSATSFRTTSGSMQVDVLPYASSASVGKSSTLHTESASGSTSLTLLSPTDASGSAKYGEPYDGTLAHLHSSHKSASGSLHLVYPPEWSGTIEGWTNSGSVKLKGKDVYTYVGGSVGPAGKHLLARKGYGASKVDFRTKSGSVGLRIGEED
ncbi:hypothetical protein LTR85_004204 [Meristemomyces frigidus]|nr:hypothetical protein LTR85_004204 [Meristemomyces frigidus]